MIYSRCVHIKKNANSTQQSAQVKSSAKSITIEKHFQYKVSVKNNGKTNILNKVFTKCAMNVQAFIFVSLENCVGKPFLLFCEGIISQTLGPNLTFVTLNCEMCLGS